MEYLASMGLVHRDIAARNILLTTNFEIKITDFGLTSNCDESFVYQSKIHRRLPIRWMSPETLTNRLFSEASDVWSFGILAWELFNKGETPYGIMEGSEILQFLLNGKILEFPENFVKIKVLLESCWNLNRGKRPSFKKIKHKMDCYLESLNLNYGYLSVNK